MTDLQFGLLLIGAVAVAAVLIYNRMQERAAGRQAERSFGSRHADALLGEPDARLLHFGFGHRHCSRGAQFVFDPRRGQGIHDLAALAFRELAVEHGEILALRPQDQPNGRGDGRGDACEQPDLFESGNVRDAARR